GRHLAEILPRASGAGDEPSGSRHGGRRGGPRPPPVDGPGGVVPYPRGGPRGLCGGAARLAGRPPPARAFRRGFEVGRPALAFAHASTGCLLPLSSPPCDWKV